MFLNDADKMLVLLALNAYGTQLTEAQASSHVITPVADLLNRVAKVDTDVAKDVEALLKLADLAEDAELDDGVDFDQDDDGLVTQIRWRDPALARDFVEKLDYPSAAMLYELLRWRLVGDPLPDFEPEDDDAFLRVNPFGDEDEEVATAAATANPVSQQELADILYGGAIDTANSVRAKDYTFMPPAAPDRNKVKHTGTREKHRTGTK